MGKYVLAYRGGGMGETPEAHEAAMQAWGTWFGSLGAAVADMGAPFGPSSQVGADGSVDSSSAGLTGYSIITADNLGSAIDLTKGCPVLTGGGSVEVYEAIAM